MTTKFIRLRTEDQSWEGLLREWEQQCVLLGEDFSNYELEPINVVKELATGAIKTDACVCAYHNGTMHAAICQIKCCYSSGLYWTGHESQNDVSCATL